MRKKQAKPSSSKYKYRVYSPSALTSAYIAVKERGLAVKTAAKQYGVPNTTLRDRVQGRVNPETIKSGPPPLFTLEEEAELYRHLTHMANLGYGFTTKEVVDKATNFAVHLGRRDKDKPLTLKWFEGFKSRWNLKVLKPRALSTCRAEGLNESVTKAYFTELEATLKQYNLLDKPHLIYNFDEKGVQTENKPPYIVTNMSRIPAVTAARSCITTILSSGNALGTQIPPFFVFKGQRMKQDLLEGTAPGSNGTVTETGWSNSEVFIDYLQTHFMKYVQRENKDQPLLLLFDGHKSHINLPVIRWAQENNVVLFVLPAHTSHALQPLDVGCFGPLQKVYDNECHKFLRLNPQTKITRYNVAALASRAYTVALSNNNLISSFKKTGIYPFDPSAIDKVQFLPSEAFKEPSNHILTHENNCSTEPDILSFFRPAEKCISDKQNSAKTAKIKTVSSVVSGKAITNNHIVEKIVDIQSNKSKEQKNTNTTKRKLNNNKTMKRNDSNKSVVKKIKTTTVEPQPGPSGLQQIFISDSETDDDDEITDDEKCCVCNRFQPKELSNCISLVITKWAQCDFNNCKHWTHLKFCTKREDFSLEVRKLELHAHINGSISESTMSELVSGMSSSYNPDSLKFKKGETGTLKEVFKLFRQIHDVINNEKAVYKVTYDVIHEFAEENVKYIELRTTPREEPSTGMTKISYIETVLRAIDDCAKENLGIIVKLLLAIDRRQSLQVAMETVQLAVKYRARSNGVIVGIDLSGDPNVGDASIFIPAFKEAQKHDLKLALHLAEVPAPDETITILKEIIPDRIGHGTCLQPDAGGTKDIVEFVASYRIPLELCMSSNIINMTVPGYDNHHFKYWYDLNHPCVICTDDKGVFSTSITEEYNIAADTFELSPDQVWQLSYNSINSIFSDESTKQLLRDKWKTVKDDMLIKS